MEKYYKTIIDLKQILKMHFLVIVVIEVFLIQIKLVTSETLWKVL